MAGHAQLIFVMTECSKTQIRLTGLIWSTYSAKLHLAANEVIFSVIRGYNGTVRILVISNLCTYLAIIWSSPCAINIWNSFPFTFNLLNKAKKKKKKKKKVMYTFTCQEKKWVGRSGFFLNLFFFFFFFLQPRQLKCTYWLSLSFTSMNFVFMKEKVTVFILLCKYFFRKWKKKFTIGVF